MTGLLWRGGSDGTGTLRCLHRSYIRRAIVKSSVLSYDSSLKMSYVMENQRFEHTCAETERKLRCSAALIAIGPLKRAIPIRNSSASQLGGPRAKIGSIWSQYAKRISRFRHSGRRQSFSPTRLLAVPCIPQSTFFFFQRSRATSCFTVRPLSRRVRSRWTRGRDAASVRRRPTCWGRTLFLLLDHMVQKIFGGLSYFRRKRWRGCRFVYGILSRNI
jgi:hypothetical protein